MKQSCFFDWRVIMNITKRLLHTAVDVLELSNELALRVAERFEYARHIQLLAVKLGGYKMDDSALEAVVSFSEKTQREIFESLHSGLREVIDSDLPLLQHMKCVALDICRMGVGAAQVHDDAFDKADEERRAPH
jgi:hypothetical protein